MNGKASHDSCIHHCIPFAFGSCYKSHTLECDECNSFFQLFEELNQKLPVECKATICEYQEQLQYYLAHQIRKVYTNAQIMANLHTSNEKNLQKLAILFGTKSNAYLQINCPIFA